MLHRYSFFTGLAASVDAVFRSFQHFLCRLENPRQFLIEQLELLKLSQQSTEAGSDLFDSSNLDAIFRILDPTGQKYITFAQYKQGERRALLK